MRQVRGEVPRQGHYPARRVLEFVHRGLHSCVIAGLTPASAPAIAPKRLRKEIRMDKRTIVWKLICSVVIVAAAVLLLSSVLGGEVIYTG